MLALGSHPGPTVRTRKHDPALRSLSVFLPRPTPAGVSPQTVAAKARNAKRPAADLSGLGVNWCGVGFRGNPASSPKGTLFETILSFAIIVKGCGARSCQVRVPIGDKNGKNALELLPRRVNSGELFRNPKWKDILGAAADLAPRVSYPHFSDCGLSLSTLLRSSSASNAR